MEYKPLYDDRYFRDLLSQISALEKKKAGYRVRTDERYRTRERQMDEDTARDERATLQRHAGSYSGAEDSSYAKALVRQHAQQAEEKKADVRRQFETENTRQVGNAVREIKSQIKNAQMVEKRRLAEFKRLNK